jgi:hypothetical protein
VGVQRNRLVHAGKIEVQPVKEPRPQVVVGVVVRADESLRARGVGEDPRAKALLDLRLLVAGCACGLLVYDPLLAVSVLDGVVDDGGFEVERKLEEPEAVRASRRTTRLEGVVRSRGVNGTQPRAV